MMFKHTFRLLIIPLIFIFLPLINGCTEADQAQLQTAAASMAQTTVAEGQELILTEAAEVGGTAVSGIGTEVAEQVSTSAAGIGTAVATSVSGVGTEAAQALTPEPPEIIATPGPGDIVTYTVIEGDNLSKIAFRFGTTTERLIELNANQYPSLLDSSNYVEVGWVIIVSIEPPATPEPVSTPYSNTPGCDVSNIYWLESPISCELIAVQFVTEISLSPGCINLEDNPLGYYKVVTIQEGWYLIDNRGVPSYMWLVDKETNQTVIGPAIVTNEISYPECGIPGNP